MILVLLAALSAHAEPSYRIGTFVEIQSRSFIEYDDVTTRTFLNRVYSDGSVSVQRRSTRKFENGGFEESVTPPKQRVRGGLDLVLVSPSQLASAALVFTECERFGGTREVVPVKAGRTAACKITYTLGTEHASAKLQSIWVSDAVPFGVVKTLISNSQGVEFSGSELTGFGW